MSEERRKAFPFHPILVAVFPVLAVFSANVGLFPLKELTTPVLIAIGLGTLALILSASLRRSVERGALVASIGLAALWSMKSLVTAVHLPTWTIWPAVVVSVVLGWLLASKPEVPTRLFNRFALLLVIVALATIGVKSRAPTAVGTSPQVGSGKAGARPDIFFIVLDGYGRADQLKRVFGFDNGPFIDALGLRGFFVADQARSNYCQTSLSLASVLNLDWMQNLALSPTGERWALNERVDRPAIVRALRSNGYDTVAIGTGFPGFSFTGFDLVVQEPAPVTYFESTLLELTPFVLPERMRDSQYDRRRDDLVEGFATLRTMAASTAKPRFVFAHILAPHPPFVFDGEKPVRPKGTFGYHDGSDYMRFVGTPASYRSGYIGQLKWVNAQVLATVDALLSRPGVKPIVMIVSDHGSKVGLDQDELSKTDVQECFSSLGAYFVPPDVQSQLSETETPLAAMRKVFAYALGAPAPATENRSYYSPFSRPYEFTDVTDRLR